MNILFVGTSNTYLEVVYVMSLHLSVEAIETLGDGLQALLGGGALHLFFLCHILCCVLELERRAVLVDEV